MILKEYVSSLLLIFKSHPKNWEQFGSILKNSKDISINNIKNLLYLYLGQF